MMFLPAKIMSDDSNFYFVTVEDHNSHVGILSQTLGVTPQSIFASQNHDIGKKKMTLRDKDLKDKTNAREFLNAYFSWLKRKCKIKDNQKEKIGLIIHNVLLDIHEKRNQLKSLGLDDKSCTCLFNLSPFPAHAKKCPKSEEMDDYNYELIRHHHIFNVKELVPLGRRFGKDFIKDLHTIISTDTIISNIYEKILTMDSNFRVGSLDQDDFLIHDHLIEGNIIGNREYNGIIIKKINLRIDNAQNILMEVKFYKVKVNGS